MTNPKSYAGFTIGPIYDVLSHSKKTRELWFGSYFFSWFMEKMIQELITKDGIEFLTPYIDKFEENHSRAGKYHDRFVIESSLTKDELYTKIEKASNNTLNYFIDIIDKFINNSYSSGKNKSDIENILKSYIQRNFVVLDPSLVGKENVVKVVDEYLNSMEEKRLFDIGTVSNTCFKCKTLPGIVKRTITDTENNVEVTRERDLCPLCFIKHFCHNSKEVQTKINEDDIFRYPPILDFAATELLCIDEVKNSDEKFKDKETDYDFKDIENAVKEINKTKSDSDKIQIKPYHKYYAVLQADGDNLGKLAGKIKNPTDLSKMLFDFAEAAEGIIKKYKGEPIYIGGDDILAFMPVAFKEGNEIKTVFDCAVELSDIYKQTINENIDNENKSTLSIGINIAYYKFPLSKALENAREQLFVKAKKKYGRNSLAIMLTKHSGHKEEFKFKFGSEEINSFSTILNQILLGKIQLPHSIHHNLARSIMVLKHIPDKARIENFFNNNFNESDHERYKEGFKELINWIEKVIIPINNSDFREKAIKELLSKLYFIKFLRGDR